MINKSLINLTPFFSTLIFIMINSTIIPIQGYSFINPSVSIVCFIYWSLRRDRFQFNLLQVFLLGILNDFLLGTPLGSSSLLFILTKILLSNLQFRLRLKANQFILEIITVSLSIIFYFLISYIFIIIYFKVYSNLNYYIMSFFLTISIYPIINTILNRLVAYMKKEDA